LTANESEEQVAAMRMKRGRRACLGAAVALLMAFAGERAEADSANGRRIAERWCAECHVIAPGQRQASDAVPTFAQISRSERFDEATLAAFLANPHHSRMPNLSLTRSEIADLVAYIRRQVH
jgi:mono/diheme cytochrome c family protein